MAVYKVVFCIRLGFVLKKGHASVALLSVSDKQLKGAQVLGNWSKRKSSLWTEVRYLQAPDVSQESRAARVPASSFCTTELYGKGKTKDQHTPQIFITATDRQIVSNSIKVNGLVAENMIPVVTHQIHKTSVLCTDWMLPNC